MVSLRAMTSEGSALLECRVWRETLTIPRQRPQQGERQLCSVSGQVANPVRNTEKDSPRRCWSAKLNAAWLTASLSASSMALAFRADRQRYV